MRDAYRSPWHAEQLQRWCRETLARWTLPHQDHDVDTSLGRTHVVSAGSGDPACLYLPGTNFCAATSTAVLEALSAGFTVFSADLPGQPGLSAPGRPGNDVRGYAAWLAEVVAWTRACHPQGPLVVAGHSRGAAVALSADPGVVEGLALLSPAGLIRVRPTAPMLGATLPWLVRRDAAGARRLLRYMAGPGRPATPLAVTWMTLVARMCKTTGAPDPYPDAVVERWRDGRVVVVVGDHDVFFPADRLREAARSRLAAPTHVVAGAGHLLVDEEPKLVADLVAAVF